MFEDRGFVDVTYRGCLGGLMTIHMARKAGRPA
jgi:ubiquinone/menaquinone biosynthesis C-methylase UbiE